MSIDIGEKIQKVSEIIFDDIYGESKFSYSKIICLLLIK